MTGRSRLEADRTELARFVEATFKYADDGTAAVLRTFAEGSNEVLASVRVPLNSTGLDQIVEHATRQATRAANATRAAVFAPPISTFVGSRARERDLGNGLVVTVEADHAPTIARRNLEYLLGSATVVVASGGQWTDPEMGVPYTNVTGDLRQASGRPAVRPLGDAARAIQPAADLHPAPSADQGQAHLMTVFTGAVDATFAAFGIDAVYTPAGGEPVSVRVIAKRPDTIVGFGETRIHAETATFELRASEVANPHAGDQLTVGGDTFVVQGEPERRDPDRLVWSLNVTPP